VVAGIVVADIFDIASWVFLFFALSLIPVLIFLYLRKRTLAAGIVGLLCLAALTAFGFAFRLKTFPPGHILHFVDDGQKYTIFGRVDDWPSITDHRTSLIIDVDSIALGRSMRKGQGRLLLTLQTETTALSHGDRLFFESKLYSIKGGKNPSGFDYRRYLNLRGVYATAYLPNHLALRIDRIGASHFYRLVEGIRGEIIGVFEKTLDTNSAAIASGFLIGETRNISAEIYSLFRDSGTLHLLAVSGSNVGLVVILFAFLLGSSPMKRTGRTILLLLIIFLFSFLAHNEPSVVRAAIMASLVLMGKYFQRRIEFNNIIAATALIILVYAPTQLYDVGFQLSFATAWGLIFFVPKTTRLFQPIKTKWQYRFLIFPLLVCIIAQLVSLPLSAFYFQRLPAVSFLSNLLIVPLVGMIVIGQLVLLLTYLLLPIIGLFVGSLLNPFLELTRYLLTLFGSGKLNLPVGHAVSGLVLVAYYIFLVLLSYSIFSKAARRLAVFCVLIFTNLFVLLSIPMEKHSDRLTILSTPGGIVSVFQGSRAQIVMSDLPPREYSVMEKIVEPYLGSLSIRPADIIALSLDYSTMREASYFLDSEDSCAIHIPVSSRNLFNSIRKKDGLGRGLQKVIFYDSSLSFDGMGGQGVFLTGQSVIYRWDSSAIVFTRNNAPFAFSSKWLQPNTGRLILIKPVIGEEELLHFGKNVKNIYAIICNRVSSKAKRLLRDSTSRSDYFPRVIETSQVGAVQLIIDKGQVRLTN